MSYPITDNLRTNIGSPIGKSLADIEHAERHDETSDALRELRDTGWKRIQVVNTGVNNVVVSGLEAYKALRFTFVNVESAATDVGLTDNLEIYFNGDQTANYSLVRWEGFTATNSIETSVILCPVPSAGTGTSSQPSSGSVTGVLHVTNPSATRRNSLIGEFAINSTADGTAFENSIVGGGWLNSSELIANATVRVSGAGPTEIYFIVDGMLQ